MDDGLIPFNISLLVLDKDKVRSLREVKSLAIFKPNTKSFDENGLFSTEIFGPVGSTIRNESFGYIELGIKVMHPLIYTRLLSLKKLYKDIIERKAYAIWDNKEKDFVLSDQENGDNGFEFFLKYADKIEFSDNNSDARRIKIELIKKQKLETMMMDKWLVLPAGLRDYMVDSSGKPSEDEVNELYRKLLNASNTLKSFKITSNDLIVLNPTRIRIQNTLVDIYEHFRRLLDGKHKWFEGVWAKRAITDGTRNVITALPIEPGHMKDPNKFRFNHTVVGLYQYIRSVAPVVKNKLHTKFISKIMHQDSVTSVLVDPKTMKTVTVEINHDKRDEWLSDEGLDSILAKLAQDELKLEPVMVDGYYLLLIYDDGKVIEPIFNTETMRDDINKKYLRPITYYELLYLSIFDIKMKYPAFFTRYPVAGLGGTYPTMMYVKTTINARKVTLRYGMQTAEITEYPILGEKTFNSLSPHYSRLKRLGGDYDGDTTSLNALTTEESIKEIDKFMNSVESYVTPDGELVHSVTTDTLEIVLKHLTL